MFTRQSMFALAALAVTAASVVASPALAGRNIAGARSVGHINIAVGRSSFTTPPSASHVHRLRNIQVGHVPLPSCPGGCIRKNVGQGDTIDQGGPGEWEEINGNLPGKGAWGN